MRFFFFGGGGGDGAVYVFAFRMSVSVSFSGISLGLTSLGCCEKEKSRLGTRAALSQPGLSVCRHACQWCDVTATCYN